MRMRTVSLLLLAALSVMAQDPALREALATGKALWSQQGDREGAVARLEPVMNALEPKAQELSPEWLRMLCEAHAWMAILEDRVPARRPQAQKHLERLIELDPGFDLDRSVTNARLQTAFDTLRTTRLAKVTLTVAPEGGILEVDGKEAPTASGTRYLKPGSHTFVYRKPGHRPQGQPLELAPRDTKAVSLTLERVASTVTLAFSPAEVSIAVDGKAVGQSRLGKDTKATAEKLGVTLDQVSEDFTVDGLGVGEHVLEISAPCHRTRRLRLPPDLATPFADHALEAVRLEKAEGRLHLNAQHEGGIAYLSGRAIGPLPVKDQVVCAGTYDLRVDFPAGAFTQRI